MGSVEEITAAITGMALIIADITTGELVQATPSIEELRLELLDLTDEQLQSREHFFYFVVHQKTLGRRPDGLVHQLNRLSACKFSTPR